MSNPAGVKGGTCKGVIHCKYSKFQANFWTKDIKCWMLKCLTFISDYFVTLVSTICCTEIRPFLLFFTILNTIVRRNYFTRTASSEDDFNSYVLHALQYARKGCFCLNVKNCMDTDPELCQWASRICIWSSWSSRELRLEKLLSPQ